MALTLSIKKVPEKLDKRSLQGELLAILEEAASPGSLTVDELWQEARRLGPPTPGDSTKMIREDRDAR
jgi:hypothetical protein